MSGVFDTRKEVDGPFTWVFEKAYDDDPDLSWLGELSSKRPDCPFYDRANHTLVVDITTTYDEENQEDKYSYEAYRMTGRGDEERAIKVDDYDPENGSVGRNEYRYISGFQATASEDDYKGCTPESVQDVIKKHGSLKLASVYTCLWDANRLSDYGNGWYSIGLRLRLLVEGEEVDEASTWGIESDLTDDYEKEVFGDLKSEMEGRLRDTAKSLHDDVKHKIKRAKLLVERAIVLDKLKDKKKDKKT